jgi:fluoroacetyl-CoA thioesterase
MKSIFNPGDSKQYHFTVQQSDVAAFQGKVVHPVCSTFTLAREIEWATRQFVLDMRDEDEEGVGTYISIEHKGPAFVGEQVVILACIESITGNELICTYEAKVDSRLIATGKTGQKILKRSKIDEIFKKG